MARIVYAVPYTPPFPGVTPWPGMQFRWTGWDGSEWDLGTRSSGVFLRGARGLNMAPLSRFAASSPALAGSRYLGSRVLEREAFWQLSVFSDAGSQAWIEYDRAFWRTMHPDLPGVWTVTQPNGEARALRCRFAGDDDPLVDTDPSRLGWGHYGVTLVAEDPYWAGELVSRSFNPSDPLDFLGTGGPPIRISEGSLAATASIANPGDVPAWPEWWIEGADSAVVGVGDRVVTVPFAIASGRMLVVDTRPAVRTAVEIDAPPLAGDGSPLPLLAQQEWVAAHLAAGVNRTKDLGSSTRFGAVPPAAAAGLAISVVGAGATVRATIAPQFFRAW